MYYLTVGAIFKNESHCLQEWIEHHLYHGVEHFYLINDESTDEFMKILQPYINKDIITLYNVKNHPKYPGKQGKLYEKYFSPLLKNKIMKWLMIIDLDEFVYSPLDQKSEDRSVNQENKDIKNVDTENTKEHLNTQTLNISNILRKYEDYALVELDWVLFGSNGHIKQPKSLIEGFTKMYKDGGFKQICNSSFHITALGVHEHHAYGKTINISLKKGTEDRIIREKKFDHNNPELIINHYQCQSLEFWQSVKMTRGDLDNYLPDNGRTLEVFKKQDRNEIEDLKLLEQNREMKYIEFGNLIEDKIFLNEIEYKNTDIPDYLMNSNNTTASQLLLSLAEELQIKDKIFYEIDHLNDRTNVDELIKNKWTGYLFTSNENEFKKLNDLYNVKYSEIKIETLLKYKNCDVLSLINNVNMVKKIFEELPNVSYFIHNPKIIVIELPFNTLREDNFIDIIRKGIEKKYTPVIFTNNFLYFVNNMFLKLLDHSHEGLKLNHSKKFKYIVSTDPYDYLYLYNNVYYKNGKYYTNELLIINTAIRNYYLSSKVLNHSRDFNPSREVANFNINKEWMIKHINTYGYHLWNYKC